MGQGVERRHRLGAHGIQPTPSPAAVLVRDCHLANRPLRFTKQVSEDLAHWKEISEYTGFVDAFVPGRWHDKQYGVPQGGYYSGSVTVVNGLPHAVFPAYFTEGGPCIDPWLPGHKKNMCLMVYQYSTPTNLSDPYLANWTQPRSFVWPTQGVQPHDVTFEDPSAAWEDPSTSGRCVFIGQTNDQKGVRLDPPTPLAS